MASNLAELGRWITDLFRRVARLESGAHLERSSITNGRMRFIGGVLRLDSGALLDLVGQWRFFGNGAITGDVVGEGKWTQNGRWEFNGDGDIDGDVALTGKITTDQVRIEGGKIYVGAGGDLIVIDGATGRIISGPVTLDRSGAFGGRLSSTGTLLLDAADAVILGAQTTVEGGVTAVGLITGTSLQSLTNINALGNITALGDIGGGSKSFWIDHPTKAGKQLRHGSLEGPEHGVYYRGVVEFDDAGEARFELPQYFSALVLDDADSTVQLTPIGRPFLVGAERVADGGVTVYGETGREAHITVTASRELFDVEPDKQPTEPIASAWTPPEEES